MLVYGQDVQPGGLNDMVVSWVHDTERRAIVVDDYADAQSTVERLLRRFASGKHDYETLRQKIVELDAPGTAIVTIVGEHRVGLMRPYLAGTAGTTPYVVCQERGYIPQTPVLCSSLDDARAFARKASDAASLPRAGWRAFHGERLRAPMARLFAQAQDGSVLLRSELEEALTRALQAPTLRVRRKQSSPHRELAGTRSV